jgi:hypothetical protein
VEEEAESCVVCFGAITLLLRSSRCARDSVTRGGYAVPNLRRWDAKTVHPHHGTEDVYLAIVV